jgi:hypothetical protein
MSRLRSASLAESATRGVSLKIVSAGISESLPRDVRVTKEPPNYSAPSYGSEME